MIIVKFICRVIWNTTEYLHLPLPFAPYIFGGMIGSWPRKVKKDGN